MGWYHTFFREFLRLEEGRVDEERTRKEVEFIDSVVEGRTILDLCCGYGRHTSALARRGYRAVGLDVDLEIVREARSRLQAREPARFVVADMRRIPFGPTFDAVINFWTSFGYLEDDAEDLLALREVAQALRPRGVFVLETVNREWALRRHQVREWWEASGGLYLEERQLDLARGRSLVRALIVHGGQLVERQLSLRLYACSELVSMLESVGLRYEAVYGGVERIPYSLDSPRLVLVTRRAG